MAAPSHSTVAPNPLNPDRTIDRRRLLIGGTALAVAAPVVAFGHPHPPASRVPPSPPEGRGQTPDPLSPPWEGEGTAAPLPPNPPAAYLPGVKTKRRESV